MSSPLAGIKILKHTEIDIGAWDECIAQSPQCLVYATSWYLDLVSPEWSAIVLYVDGKYAAVFPLTLKCKWGFSYLIQPFATQQLGFFYKGQADEFVNFALNLIKKISGSQIITLIQIIHQ